MEIYCGLCGQKAHQLFSHLRDVHEMSPDMATANIPAPCSASLRRRHSPSIGDGSWALPS